MREISARCAGETGCISAFICLLGTAIQPHYGTPQYIEIYRAQLTELLTNYGPIFEVWHDGANGGDGFYGGARERARIDKRTYYDWPNTWALVRKLQPNAVIFSDVGPDVRWVGNERGIAGDPSWATFEPVAVDGGPASPGDVRDKESPTGHRNGAKWLPAECDVSIRPGWFWHERENARVKTPAQLIDLYYKSVGRGATFLLNVPPNRDGLLNAEDIASLKGFGDYRRKTFGKALASAKGGSDRREAAGDVQRDPPARGHPAGSADRLRWSWSGRTAGRGSRSRRRLRSGRAG